MIFQQTILSKPNSFLKGWILIIMLYQQKNSASQMNILMEIPFTRESWNGRIKACRGIGASLTNEEISMWEQEHKEFLKRILY